MWTHEFDRTHPLRTEGIFHLTNAGQEPIVNLALMTGWMVSLSDQPRWHARQTRVRVILPGQTVGVRGEWDGPVQGNFEDYAWPELYWIDSAGNDFTTENSKLQLRLPDSRYVDVPDF